MTPSVVASGDINPSDATASLCSGEHSSNLLGVDKYRNSPKGTNADDVSAHGDAKCQVLASTSVALSLHSIIRISTAD